MAQNTPLQNELPPLEYDSDGDELPDLEPRGDPEIPTLQQVIHPIPSAPSSQNSAYQWFEDPHGGGGSNSYTFTNAHRFMFARPRQRSIEQEIIEAFLALMARQVADTQLDMLRRAIPDPIADRDIRDPAEILARSILRGMDVPIEPMRIHVVAMGEPRAGIAHTPAVVIPAQTMYHNFGGHQREDLAPNMLSRMHAAIVPGRAADGRMIGNGWVETPVHSLEDAFRFARRERKQHQQQSFFTSSSIFAYGLF